MNVRIAVDAMGGDFAPSEVVSGALMALGGLAVDVLLVGPGNALRGELARMPERRFSIVDGDIATGAAGIQRPGTGELRHLSVIDAPDVVAMDEHATDAVRSKPHSSMMVGLRLVKEGRADAFVTCGNTGAAMAGALLTLGRVRGIARPALATVVPNGASGLGLLLDVGANAECRPRHLLQFAYMGAGYMARTFGIPRPRVGLLSIGEEDSKGNALVIETNRLLRQSRLNFVGNVEGKDLTRNVADVVVTDGFTGNVVLKTAEGTAELLFNELRRVFELTPWNRAAGLLLMSELRKLKRRLDYAEYGGALLLGVDGIVVIGHGRSKARAVFNAIRAAAEAVRNGVLDVIRETAAEVPARPNHQPEPEPDE